jgi:hypothetical protein
MRFVFVSVLAMACSAAEPAPKTPAPEGQSYAAAIRTICEVDRHAGANPEDPLEVASKREEYWMEHVKNGDGIYFLTLFRIQGPAERAAMLEKEAAAAQIPDCALIESLRAAAAIG